MDVSEILPIIIQNCGLLRLQLLYIPLHHVLHYYYSFLKWHNISHWYVSFSTACLRLKLPVLAHVRATHTHAHTHTRALSLTFRCIPCTALLEFSTACLHTMHCTAHIVYWWRQNESLIKFGLYPDMNILDIELIRTCVWLRCCY